MNPTRKIKTRRQLKKNNNKNNDNDENNKNNEKNEKSINEH